MAVDGAGLERRLLWKQDLRIIPLSAAIYFLCFLDRSNICNARILNSTTGDDMQSSARMTDYQFVIALMVFLVAYAVFEVPSNILLKKLRPSRWLAFLMLCWGTMTMCLGAASSFASVTALRFLLGMFEAGLFPGLVYFLTFWYRHDERSVRVALVLASATLAGAVSPPCHVAPHLTLHPPPAPRLPPSPARGPGPPAFGSADALGCSLAAPWPTASGT